MNDTATTEDLKREIERLRQELENRELAKQELEDFPPAFDIHEFVEKNPVTAALIALGLGVTVGYILRNSNILDTLTEKVGEAFEKGIADEQTILNLINKMSGGK